MAKTIEIIITRQTTPIREKSFSIPCIFTSESSLDVSFVQGTSRAYTDIEGVAADFATSGDTYKSVQALMSQENQLSEFRIFRKNNVQAQVKTLAFASALTAGHTIKGTVNGVALTDTVFITDMATTLAALKAKIEVIEGVDTVVVTGNNVAVTGESDYDVNLTSFSVTGVGSPNVDVNITTAGNTFGTDIVTASLENKDWYVALSIAANKGAILSGAAAVEAQGKLLFAMTADADVKTSVTTDVMSLAKARSYSRTAIFYTHDTSEFFPFALCGRHLPLKPGKIIFSLKTLAGVSVSPTITSSEINNILSKNGNVYVEELGKSLTKPGRVSGGDFIDTIRDIDYLNAQLTLNLFLFITNANKLGYIDENIVAADGVMKTVFKQMFEEGIIKNDYTTKPPKAIDVPVNLRANRTLPDLPFTVNLQGAIQSISVSGIAKV